MRLPRTDAKLRQPGAEPERQRMHGRGGTQQRYHPFSLTAKDRRATALARARSRRQRNGEVHTIRRPRPDVPPTTHPPSSAKTPPATKVRIGERSSFRRSFTLLPHHVFACRFTSHQMKHNRTGCATFIAYRWSSRCPQLRQGLSLPESH